MSDQANIPPHSEEQRAQMPLADLMRTRRQKINMLRAQGIEPYPYKYDRTHDIADTLNRFEQYSADQTVVRITGRIMLKRKMGKTSFAHIRDYSDQIQIYVRKDEVGDSAYEVFDSFDLGDIVGCEGTLFTTKTGEKTLRVRQFELLSKALHPLPDKHSGLQDKEVRYRRRYADLIANPEVREVFAVRSKIIQAVRDFLNEKGFLEVETPVLQPIYGGAMARPFVTHHNTLDLDMYLRIADELYLKRLIVGGYDKVWELCKDFRNEGMDRLHNPEFSMVELYWAYADYRDVAVLVEELYRYVVMQVLGSHKVTFGDMEIDFGPQFKWVTMLGSIQEQTGVALDDMSYEEAIAVAKTLGVENADELINWGKTVEAIWEAKVEPTLVQPTFIADFPVEISPLAKRHRDNQRLTERFELFIGGQEMGNAFSELNDPFDQLERFMQQGKAIEAGDEEAQPLDDDFITALSYGMPPTGGLGFGIDRLVMLLTNQHSIRDVIFFPQMRDLGEGSMPVSRILAQILEDEKE